MQIVLNEIIGRDRPLLPIKNSCMVDPLSYRMVQVPGAAASTQGCKSSIVLLSLGRWICCDIVASSETWRQLSKYAVALFLDITITIML